MKKVNTEKMDEKKKDDTFIRKFGMFASESAVSVGKYIVGKLAASTIIGLIAFVVFRILGINLAWLLAIILGLTNIVPIVGPWVGLLICAIIVVFFSPIYALYTTLTALVLQMIEQFFLLPVIVGKAIDLKPLLIICVIVIGSIIFGFWGVLLAVPIAAIVKIGYRIFFVKEKKEQEISDK